MAKTRPTTLAPAEQASLRELADRMLARAKQIRAPNMKERAMHLARLLLQDDRNFGGRQLRDEQTTAMLEAEEIGLASFKKALTAVRRELPKVLPALKTVRPKPRGPKLAPPAPAAAVPAQPSPSGGSVAATLNRSLI